MLHRQGAAIRQMDVKWHERRMLQYLAKLLDRHEDRIIPQDHRRFYHCQVSAEFIARTSCLRETPSALHRRRASPRRHYSRTRPRRRHTSCSPSRNRPCIPGRKLAHIDCKPERQSSSPTEFVCQTSHGSSRNHSRKPSTLRSPRLAVIFSSLFVPLGTLRSLGLVADRASAATGVARTLHTTIARGVA